MKEYIVTGASITSHYGPTYRQGQTITENQLRPDDVTFLLGLDAIKEKTAEAPAEVPAEADGKKKK